MKIGYYCPLVGELFLKKLGIVSIDLRTIDYQARDTTYCQSGSNKCSLICQMSGLTQKSYSLDGIILTNCCHEQEQLVDFLSKGDKVKVFKINIPRNRSSAAVKFLADQLEVLARQIGGCSTKLQSLDQMPNPTFNSRNGSAVDFLPVMVYGISIPPWLDGLLKQNKLLAVIEEKCGLLFRDGEQQFLADVDLSLACASTIVYQGSCIRSTFQVGRKSLLEIERTDRWPLAVLFTSLEYCTASTYGFVGFKDYFQTKKIPVFKIVIPEWNKPSVKVITQIESIAHICKETKR
jgi:hypothetical protein